MNNNVLVIGGSGFLGSHVIYQLLLKDFKVTNLDTNPCSISDINLTHVTANIVEDLSFLNENKDKFDYVLNFAGISDLDYCHNNPKEALTVNILSNLNIVDLLKDSNSIKKYVYASSAYASGTSGSFYAIGKKACENIIKEYSENYNLNFTILRYGSLYGLGSDKRNSIYRFLKSATKDSVIKYSGTGDEVREFINVKDAAELTIESFKEEYDRNILMLTGTKSMKYKNLFDMINEIFNNSLTVKIEKNNKKTHYKNTPYSYQKDIVKKLTNNPHIDLGEGLIEIIESLSNEN
jgi:UDP-glucose 4-epimerase